MTWRERKRGEGCELLQQGPGVCVYMCMCVFGVLWPRASHTHSTKTMAQIPQGFGVVGVSHVLINGSLILLSQYRKPGKSLKSTDKGHHQRQREGRGGQGPAERQRDTENREQKDKEEERCLP